MAEPISLLRYPDLTEKTYEVIKDQIVRSQLLPGERLLVVDLAQRLGISRTPVKDALNRLAAEGLVVRVPRKGFLVSNLDCKEVAELMDARIMVELAAAERGINLVQPSEIEEMRRIITEMESLVDENGQYIDYPGCASRDCALHLLIVSTARNRRIIEIYQDLNIHTYMVRMHHATEFGFRRTLTMLKDHRAILKAFELRDLPALKDAITHNIQGFMKAFEAVTQTNQA
ncbi:MAG: GntR family transcriptional regulator [Chloroflexota bacterium]|jgi:DNA-binding GntR family transcriptional regulator